jgi:hypothetical protein
MVNVVQYRSINQAGMQPQPASSEYHCETACHDQKRSPSLLEVEHKKEQQHEWVQQIDNPNHPIDAKSHA